jgi:hypothetical protein
VNEEVPNPKEIVMPSVAIVPPAYRVALEDLAAACREAGDVADALEYAVALLRCRRPDPDGPPTDLYAAAGRLRKALEGLDRAWDGARLAWDLLPAAQREGLPSPDELLEAEVYAP